MIVGVLPGKSCAIKKRRTGRAGWISGILNPMLTAGRQSVHRGQSGREGVAAWRAPRWLAGVLRLRLVLMRPLLVLFLLVGMLFAGVLLVGMLFAGVLLVGVLLAGV